LFSGSSPGDDRLEYAKRAKACRIPLNSPRPIDEAISSAGGVCWRELDDQLMSLKHPGLFVAGEMIDWEAPTGGYLMQGCFATGTHAGKAATKFLKERD
jgi:predicted flavoprotein YhiN